MLLIILILLENAMMRNYSALCELGIVIFFAASSVCREAIIGGKTAEADQFPYQVAFYVNGQNWCGGGIIGEQHILTAAHCVVDEHGEKQYLSMAIVAGTNDLGKSRHSAVLAHVEKFYVLADFRSNDITNVGDIAVVKLKYALVMSKHIAKLELPKHRDETYVGKTAILAGFGWDWAKQKVGSVSGGHTNLLQRYSKVDILGDAHKCFDKRTNMDKQLCGRLKQHHFHKQEAAASLGDSGSPLVLDGHVVIGILSAGAFIGAQRLPGGQYTRVASYLDFINDAKHDKSNNYTRVHELHVNI